ncbi:hypothetical protein ASPZODRAFT_140845 [Penicilliopsis zonata CBS 506.65]|uniref:F-box domain-containing protein n=1 Tax=Penicilliopsis zonata CBS 506.65 TaxID=1073090 RepID=A0A1L9SMR4_9EURO|nr:hypothetical protein ASPZODRAFT_140845 [Penicilliopsis zonata CBS 506.65]OJJ48562.1 hypothetical protein ASPZODRAFT_140845 [Penicilliopsis zonata CBS 506.65]
MPQAYETFNTRVDVPYSMILAWNARYINGTNATRPPGVRTPFWRPVQNPPEPPFKPEPIVPFRILDLPPELREAILYLALENTSAYSLDRQVITLGSPMRSNVFIPRRTVWQNSTGQFLRLLLVSKQVNAEVQRMLFNRFAFDTPGWGRLLQRWSRATGGRASLLSSSSPSLLTISTLPIKQLKHLVYTPHYTERIGEHEISIARVVSLLRSLCDVRILVTWACAQVLLGKDNQQQGNNQTQIDTMKGALHIVRVARLFSPVKKVAVVGQSLATPEEKRMLDEARDMLKEERWYWELPSDYAFSSPSSSSAIERTL